MEAGTPRLRGDTVFEARLVEGGFPRHAWYKVEDTVFEARLVNRGDGSYKGYPLKDDEWPAGIESIYG